jgi:hypothetical protein
LEILTAAARAMGMSPTDLDHAVWQSVAEIDQVGGIAQPFVDQRNQIYRGHDHVLPLDTGLPASHHSG